MRDQIAMRMILIGTSIMAVPMSIAVMAWATVMATRNGKPRSQKGREKCRFQTNVCEFHTMILRIF